MLQGCNNCHPVFYPNLEYRPELSHVNWKIQLRLCTTLDWYCQKELSIHITHITHITHSCMQCHLPLPLALLHLGRQAMTSRHPKIPSDSSCKVTHFITNDMILPAWCVILLNRTIIKKHFLYPKKSKEQTFAFGVVGNLLHFTWIILKTSHFVWSTGLPRSIRPLPWSHPQETSHGRRTWVHVEVTFQPCWDPRFLHKLFTGCFF